MSTPTITISGTGVNVATSAPKPVDVAIGKAGPPGPPGPPGPEGGTPVVAVPYNSWPPANPQPGTLYLRLAP